MLPIFSAAVTAAAAVGTVEKCCVSETMIRCRLTTSGATINWYVLSVSVFTKCHL